MTTDEAEAFARHREAIEAPLKAEIEQLQAEAESYRQELEKHHKNWCKAETSLNEFFLLAQNLDCALLLAEDYQPEQTVRSFVKESPAFREFHAYLGDYGDD